MKLEPTDAGFAIDAKDLGRLLERAPEEVQRLMRNGAITSRFERGEGEDAGRSRVTFIDGDRRVRLTIRNDGEVLMRNRVRLTPPPGSGRRASPPNRRNDDDAG